MTGEGAPQHTPQGKGQGKKVQGQPVFDLILVVDLVAFAVLKAFLITPSSVFMDMGCFFGLDDVGIIYADMW